ncbi:MAG: XRE family transcriptional regulator [Bradyrhizobiaceae bacterium]|nr:MAG: XRE family transcriptional regulator [Bradyrhizobiaceae bacterium]
MARSGFGKRFPARDSAVTKTLASNVKRLRKERGWTQDALAAEIEQAAVTLIENGRANPTLLILEELATALEVQLPDLLSPSPKTKRSKDK